MKIHEYQAKAIFASYDIPVPQGHVASTPAEAEKIAADFGGVVAVKAQVHAGGRGKAGGVKIAKSPAEARDAADQILGMNIKWSTVGKVLVEQGADISKEAYLGLIVDRGDQSIGFICSSEGGVEIEEVAANAPEKIIRFSTTSKTFPEKDAEGAALALFNDKAAVPDAVDIMRKLFTMFVEKDCSLAEINPLVLTGDGAVIALDGKINFDDNALFRQADVVEMRDLTEEDENETEAREKGLSYVQLDGDIGCMVNGAGLAMATMDMIKLFGGDPANFLDVGGSSNPEKVVNAFKILLRSGKVKAILINIFGGITRCDDIAKGILQAFEQMDLTVPIVVRLVGTNEVEGRALLEGTQLIPAASLSDGVKKAIAVAKGGAA